MAINYYIANATGKLDKLQDKIEQSVREAKELGTKLLNVDEVDIIFSYHPKYTIPELGVGAYTLSEDRIDIRLDPSKEIEVAEITAQLVHEMHHTVRWQEPGYGKTFAETMVSEGLATLFEEEALGKTPIYSQVELPVEEINLANSILDKEDYDHYVWFFGNGDITRWFAYTYGYRICKEYGKKTSKTAAELVHEPASSFYS